MENKKECARLSCQKSKLFQNTNRCNKSNPDLDNHIHTGKIVKKRMTHFVSLAHQTRKEFTSVMQLQLFHFKQMSLSSTKYTRLCDGVCSCLDVRAVTSVCLSPLPRRPSEDKSPPSVSSSVNTQKVEADVIAHNHRHIHTFPPKA